MSLLKTRPSLADRLHAYSQGNAYPMHMPGHKRRGEEVDPRLPWRLDITEIHGFDNLHEPEDIFLNMQREAAALYGSGRAFIMVNGSTGGILAAIGACTLPGEEIIVARNCHKSVYHAMEIGNLIPHYLQPETSPLFPFCGSISPDSVRSALAAHPAARAVVITSPTYEGILSDIPAIAEACHGHNIPLIVDSAHGAHLGFDPYFPENAVREGADLVVQSLHKTLPSLTQTALLHVSGPIVRAERVAHQIDVYETSSPSYILTASADACLRFLKEEGSARFAGYAGRLTRFYEACAPLKHLAVADQHMLQTGNPAFCHGFDPGKLTVLCTRANISGYELMNRLREEAEIECEMALDGETLAMTSVMDDEEGFSRLAGALLAIDRTLCSTSGAACPSDPPITIHIPQRQTSIREALAAEQELIPWQDAEGRIAGDYFWIYPPGIPWVTPGETIDETILAALPDPSARFPVLLRSAPT